MIKLKRKNGFSRPFGLTQVLTWALVLLEIVFIPLFVISVLRVGLIVRCKQVVCSAVFVFSFGAMAYFWRKVSVIDFSDSAKYDVQNGKLCNYCLGMVNFHCKHCKVCNKCVYKFDHHCSVLNTCIGEKNYKGFILLLASILVFKLNILVFSLRNIVMFFFFKPAFTIDNKFFFNSVNMKAVIIVNLSVFILMFFICLYTSYLLCFHWYLNSKKMTTYDYIISKKSTKVTTTYIKESIGNKTEIENTRITPNSNLT